MEHKQNSIWNFIEIISSIISIIQFVISVPSIFLDKPLLDFRDLFTDTRLGFRILLILILESSIAYFASMLYRKTEEKYYSVSRYFFSTILISVFTVWTSFFNIQQIAINKPLIHNQIILFLFLLGASDLLSGFFVVLEMEKPFITILIRTLSYGAFFLTALYL